jgi:hypothetical protein
MDIPTCIFYQTNSINVNSIDMMAILGVTLQVKTKNSQRKIHYSI